jgi:hypothetical protein
LADASIARELGHVACVQLSKEAWSDAVHRLLFTFIVALALPAQAARNAAEEVSAREIAQALKDALSVSAEGAIRRLGREDGFLLNQKVRIALPENLARAATTLRRFGMARYPEELETTMNRAAEAAVPELRVLLLDAIARIGFDDARAVIAASDQSAARYFRAQTQAALETRFLPAVQRVTRKLHVADAYNQVASRAAKVGLVRSENANLDEYIARKALEGVYATMAEEERALRASPIRPTQKVLRSASGAR